MSANALPSAATEPGEPAGQGLHARAARGAGWVAVGAFVSNLVASLVMLTLAAVLTPADLGVLAIGQLVFIVANTLQDFGFWDVLIYYRGKAERAAEAVLLCWASASIVLALLIIAGSPLVAGFFGEPRATPVVAVAGGLLVCYAVAGVPMAMRTRSLDLRHRAQVQMSAVLIGGSVTVLLALGPELGIAAMVIGQIVQGLALVTLAWAVGPRMRPRWDGAVVREMLAYGRHAYGSALFTIVQYNVDYLVVGRVLGAAALGTYSLGFRISFLPYALITVVLSSTMFALVCRIEAEQKPAVVERYTRTVLLLVTPLATGLVLFAPAVVLLGDKWSPAVPVVRALGVYVLLTSLASMAEVGLKSVGRPELAVVSSGVHLGLLVLLLVLFTSRGVGGVAVLRAGLAGLVAVLAWSMLCRVLAIPGRRALGLLRLPAAAAGAMAAVTWLTSWDIDGGDPVSPVAMAAQAAAAVLAYVLVVGLADREAARSAARLVTRRGR